MQDGLLYGLFFVHAGVVRFFFLHVYEAGNVSTRVALEQIKVGSFTYECTEMIDESCLDERPLGEFAVVGPF